MKAEDVVVVFITVSLMATSSSQASSKLSMFMGMM